TRTRHLRVEMLARNSLNCGLPDAGGCVPASATITFDAPADLPLPAPSHRLLMAARATGVPAERSRNARGSLSDYLCSRAAEPAGTGAPRLATFIHVPAVRRPGLLRATRTAITFDDLVLAGEAILQQVAAAIRAKR